MFVNNIDDHYDFIVTVCGLWLLQTLSLCACVCPTFMVYILLTMDRTLIKFGENVGTLVQLFLVQLYKNFIKIGLVLTYL